MPKKINTVRFPIEKVKAITQTKPATNPAGGIVGCDLTPVQLRQLLDVGVLGSTDSSDESPMVEEFLDLGREFPPQDCCFTYQAHILYPSRTDAHGYVVVKGFTVEGLTADQAVVLLKRFRHADELDAERRQGGYWLSFWWG